MKFIVNILLFFLFSFFGFSYTQNGTGSYSACEGTINIFKSHSFDLQFLGSKGKNNRFSKYLALNHLNSGNQIWFSFIAPTDGKIALDLVSKSEGYTLVVFDANGNDVCSEIDKGNAEIVRLVSSGQKNKLGLSEEVSDNYLYPAKISAGKTLHFVVIAEHSLAEIVQMDFKFISDDVSFSEYETRELNYKKDDFSPSLIIQVRDKETGNPLIATLILKGTRGYDGIYNGSDLLFDASKTGKISYSCEQEGYFFKDSANISIVSHQDNVILIELEPVRTGKSVQMEDIEFVAGTSNISDKSLPKLKRLRDFLAINSMITIEIQGHVLDPGTGNSLMGQKMSEARAKRVMKYLVDNGISKERMTAVGYGNTRPIYKFPKNHSEEQANRRVEILIK